MTTLAVITFPASEIALGETIEELTGCRFRAEESAFRASTPSLNVWVSGCEQDALVEALDADSSVAEFEIVRQGDEEFLVGLDLDEGTLVPQAIIEEVDGTVREAYAGDDNWYLEVRFPEREDLSTVGDLFERYGINAVYESITQIEDETDRRLNELSDPQREAIQKAIDMGYYDVPRGATLKDLAEEFDVSHQALSERLRRAQEKLATSQLQKETASQRNVTNK